MAPLRLFAFALLLPATLSVQAAPDKETLPEGARLGTNANAFRGGFRLWQAKQSRA